MTREEYCQEVLTQLRRLTGEEQKAVWQELADHMEDHVCDLLDLGWDREAAEARTLELMGDPGEVGQALNRQYPRGWLILSRAAIAVTAVVCVMAALSVGMLGFLWESIVWRVSPPEITTSLEVERSQAVDLRVRIGNDVLRVYRISVGWKDGEYLAEAAVCVYDRFPGGVVSDRMLSDLRMGDQRGEVWQGAGGGGGGHWLGEYRWKRTPVRPGDDHITLRYERFGECVAVDVPLPLPEEGAL